MSTTQLPPDPEGMNDQRAEWAEDCLSHFMGLTNCEREEAPGDLIANIMHWCDRNGMEFDSVVTGARMHYEAETQG